VSGAWQEAERGKVSGPLFTYVRAIDRVQFDIFNRFKQNEGLYDVSTRPGIRAHRPRGIGRMHENAIANAVDALSAQIATTEVRAVFDTDDADWGTQRRAKHLEWYAEALGKRLKVPQKARYAFKAGGTVKGTAVVKVYNDKFKRPCVEPARIDDIVVNEDETRSGGEPLQLHHRTIVDRAVLRASYPKLKAQIDKAQGGFGQWQLWAGWRPLERNDVVVIESWYRALGVKGMDGYVPGRHVKAIDGLDLEDEEWNEEDFPFAVMMFSKPVGGWYGIGVVDRIASIQIALNRRNLQNERKLDQGAFPTTYCQPQDAQLATQQASVFQNALGTVAVYRGSQPPTVINPPTVSPEELRDAERLSSKVYEVSGISRMAAQAVKPPGIESGEALRAYRDQTTQRFAEPEKDYEQFVLDIIWLLLGCCKKLGADAPEMSRSSRFGLRKIPWSKVDMGDVRVWISAASTLSRTRAGREQTVTEWAQAGIISQDSARRLIGHPDLEREMSLYTAAIESVEECIEEIADGGSVTPEPFMNLKLAVWRCQQQYLNWRKAPEEILEELRGFIVTAAWMSDGGNAPAAGQSAGPGPDVSMPDGMPPPGTPPPMNAGPPMMPPPQAAFSPQAMQLAPGV
jgi:hypothetical protein